MQTLEELMANLPQTGELQWIGLRPARDAPLVTPQETHAIAGQGLEGDRFAGRSTRREVTLVQFEHLAVIGSILGREVEARLLRRNLAVLGINLLALKGRQFAIGEAVLEYSGLAHPCSKMETALGPGGYNAMRGHGGITACIVRSGRIAVGDAVTAM